MAMIATLKRRRTGTDTLPAGVRSFVSCLGCLQRPPSTVLACGHAFCRDCIRELTEHDALPHRCKTIRCPIHKTQQEFSPRLLPIQSGFRILSLDGCGVTCFAQLIMLEHIEQRCFGIPLMHLFDLVVGTSIGGQIALALTTQTQCGSLTAAAAIDKFRGLITVAFERKSSRPLCMGGTIYKTEPLERALQDLFGKETKLFSGATSSQSNPPNVAVTTVVLPSFEAYLITN